MIPATQTVSNAASNGAYHRLCRAYAQLHGALPEELPERAIRFTTRQAIRRRFLRGQPDGTRSASGWEERGWHRRTSITFAAGNALPRQSGLYPSGRRRDISSAGVGAVTRARCENSARRSSAPSRECPRDWHRASACRAAVIQRPAAFPPRWRGPSWRVGQRPWRDQHRRTGSTEVAQPGFPAPQPAPRPARFATTGRGRGNRARRRGPPGGANSSSMASFRMTGAHAAARLAALERSCRSASAGLQRCSHRNIPPNRTGILDSGRKGGR